MAGTRTGNGRGCGQNRNGLTRTKLFGLFPLPLLLLLVPGLEFSFSVRMGEVLGVLPHLNRIGQIPLQHGLFVLIQLIDSLFSLSLGLFTSRIFVVSFFCIATAFHVDFYKVLREMRLGKNRQIITYSHSDDFPDRRLPRRRNWNPKWNRLRRWKAARHFPGRIDCTFSISWTSCTSSFHSKNRETSS